MVRMNKRETLSIAPYYGGKGRMAHFIAERLNYDDSDIFVTPFGGMCRVLLNKPRHKVEYYNDYSSGLTALMRILSDPVDAVEFIHRLEDETVYSKEEFNKQKALFDNAENDLEQQEREKLRQLLIENKIVSAVTANNLIDEIGLHPFLPRNPAKAKRKKAVRERIDPISDSVKAAIKKLQQILKDNEQFRIEFQQQFGTWIGLFWQKLDDGFLERTPDLYYTSSDEDSIQDISDKGVNQAISDMDLAIATYVVFQQSRDGMGKAWSAEKFKTNDQYRRQIVKLFDCAERLEGIEVFQIDAMLFFRNMMFVDPDTPLNEVPPQFQVLSEWINNPRVMMYCDPSYISVESEKILLEGIDVDNTPRLSDAIKKKYGDKMPKNLGKVYAMSFGYDDQEKFLRCIQKAKCRILVSNYDLQLYNKYLNEETGWRREEFHTTTGVGSKKDNKRVEVIWYNY